MQRMSSYISKSQITFQYSFVVDNNNGLLLTKSLAVIIVNNCYRTSTFMEVFAAKSKNVSSILFYSFLLQKIDVNRVSRILKILHFI